MPVRGLPLLSGQEADDGGPRTEPDDPLVTFDHQQAKMADAMKDVATKKDTDRLDKKRKRGNRVLIALLILALVGGYLFTYSVSRSVGEVAGTQASNDRAIRSSLSALDKTNIQRNRVGLPPIDVPKVAAELNDPNSGTTASDVSALNTIAKLQTDPRLRDLPTIIGDAGKDGTPCLPSDPACIGLPGIPGTNGDPGDPGDPGEPGEAGKQGELGPSGIPGDKGEQGIQGIPGEQGAKGPPGPIASPTNASFVGGAGSCSYVTNYDNGAQTSAAVPDAFCGGSAPADSTEPTE